MVAFRNHNQRPMQTKTLGKALLQLGITAVFIIGVWLLLSQVDWMGVLGIERITDKTEEKLGDLLWEYSSKTEKEVNHPYILNTVDSIVNRLCAANNIERSSIKLHVIESTEPNAYALPNGHLVVLTGLISYSENDEEMTGVLGHEIAHIQLKHVMKKLSKEIGISVLLSMTTNGTGSDVLGQAAQVLTSSAFDRALEKEADLKAVEYLQNAKVDPKPFAQLLGRFAQGESEVQEYLDWTSTHPASAERSTYILDLANSVPTTYEPILSDSTWKKCKEIVNY